MGLCGRQEIGPNPPGNAPAADQRH